jgi:hypothetical protein
MRTASWTARTVKLPTRKNRASTIWAAKRRCGRLSVSLSHEIHGFPARKCRNSVPAKSNYAANGVRRVFEGHKAAAPLRTSMAAWSAMGTQGDPVST